MALPQSQHHQQHQAVTTTRTTTIRDKKGRGRRSGKRRRQYIMSLCSDVWLLLLLLSHCVGQLQAQDNSSNTSSSTVAPTLTLDLNISTVPTSVEAQFVLRFHLDAFLEDAGIMNEAEEDQFGEAMAGLTSDFAPELFPFVTTICVVLTQSRVESPRPTLAPSFALDRNATFTISSGNGSDSGTGQTRRSLQDNTNTNTTQTETPTPTTFYYEYIFQMNYSSSTIDVNSFPQRFEEHFQNYLNSFSQVFAQEVLNLTYQNNLQITRMQWTEQEPPIPVTIPPILDTDTVTPTPQPTDSLPPTMVPSSSVAPSLSPQPSSLPSNQPSPIPSNAPSIAPSMAPTFQINSSAIDNFALVFTLQAFEGAGYLNQTQEDQFCQIMVNQTPIFQPLTANRVKTQCLFFTDTFTRATVVVTPAPTPPPTLLPTSAPTVPNNNRRQRLLRSLQETYTTTIYRYTYTFRMRYTSASINVTNYTREFKQHVTENPGYFEETLTGLLDLTPNNNLTLFSINVFETVTDAPTFATPTPSPTVAPTVKVTPFPSYRPTEAPTIPPPTLVPSSTPTQIPTNMPTLPPESQDTTIIIVVTMVVVLAALILVAMAWFYRTRRQSKLQRQEALSEQRRAHRKNTQERRGQPSSLQTSNTPGGSNNYNYSSNNNPHHHPFYDHTVATSPISQLTADQNFMMYSNNINMGPYPPRTMLSASDSILSNPSLLSNGQGVDDDEHDDDDDDDDDDIMNRHSKLSPLDDFDRFKDQNLEKMRSVVQQSVTGMDSMMSQALTMSILGNSLGWDSQDGIEIEANALCDVTDWMKRHESYASEEERKSFMQDLLNKVVTSVRLGTLGPDDASKITYECAALLNLPLAHDLPVDTIIVWGVRKTVRTNDVIRAFRKFGSIEDAAVASGQRGFGIVRYRDPKSVHKAMTQFRTSEIVVQDTAVQIKPVAPERDV